MMAPCEPGCGAGDRAPSVRLSPAACCWRVRASSRTTRSCAGSISKSGAGSSPGRAQAGARARGRRWRCRGGQPALVAGLRQSDTLTDGRRFRILAVVDDFTPREPGLVADTSLSGQRVARELDAIGRGAADR